MTELPKKPIPGKETTMHRIPRYQVTLIRDGSIAYSYPRFTNSRDIFAEFREQFLSLDREHFFVLTLDSKNKLIGMHDISTGSINSSIVHPREVLKPVILSNAAAVIFIHNHPSGDPIPSKEDRDCTDRLVKCFNIFGIRVLDHIVIGETDYFSFADSGMLGAI